MKRLGEPQQEHFISLGYRFNRDAEHIERELKSIMGRKRFAEYLQLAEACHGGAAPFFWSYW